MPGNIFSREEHMPGTLPENFRMIVIGGSAGGFEAMKTIVKALPEDLNAALFIVWHMAAKMRGILPEVFNALGPLFAAHAVDMEPIVCRKIYVAPPDHHLLLNKGLVRVTCGPKENYFRPAVDPLFSSAARAYGNRVIGVILSGALDDGTMGLLAVKNGGGIAIVQDPAEAEVRSMPDHAVSKVQVDHCIQVSKMADLLTRLCHEKIPGAGK